MKIRILRFIYSFKLLYYNLKGVKFGKRCFVSGFPELRRCKASEIVVGNEVVMHSKKKYNTLIRLPIAISTVEPGARVELHDHCGLSGCKIVCANHVSVGEYTIIGPDAILYDCKEHEYSPEIGWLGRTQRTGKPIIIGKRCYIGMRSIILKGVTIGDDCVVAAGAVVTKDMPSGHIAIGNPATYRPLPSHLTAPAP